MADSTEDIVPAGWEKRLSRSTGMHYYLNIYTKESQWDLPTSPATDGVVCLINSFHKFSFE